MALSSGRIRLIAKALAGATDQELDQINQLIEKEGGQPLAPAKRPAPKTTTYQTPKADD